MQKPPTVVTRLKISPPRSHGTPWVGINAAGIKWWRWVSNFVEVLFWHLISANLCFIGTTRYSNSYCLRVVLTIIIWQGDKRALKGCRHGGRQSHLSLVTRCVLTNNLLLLFSFIGTSFRWQHPAPKAQEQTEHSFGTLWNLDHVISRNIWIWLDFQITNNHMSFNAKTKQNNHMSSGELARLLALPLAWDIMTTKGQLLKLTLTCALCMNLFM